MSSAVLEARQDRTSALTLQADKAVILEVLIFFQCAGVYGSPLLPQTRAVRGALQTDFYVT